MVFAKDQKELMAQALKFYAEHLDRAANEAFSASPDHGNYMYEVYKNKAMKVRVIENRVYEAETIEYI